MALLPPPTLPPPAPNGVGYHGAVSEFKRRLIEATLHQVRGNRTHAARALGLQRTYLLRLIRDLGVAAPPPPERLVVSGGPDLAPTPPNARSAPGDPSRSSITGGSMRGADMAPTSPPARRTPA